ncbi:hypothetical protein AMAG_17744 [Allomyces macrogynus ATCC 38327]|uniref:Uncharacterized protein n=1 Tax=Allomyces macrogynus (strain ATCC 38327) TaxID=578462 RepID=A0A0L0RYK0_ALLM3|nr:hypothetical protein AMAG_17744 [Allomyces macrogynus ATCC 38327]|eukprot:KNE55136.1 hypothetical protein AMAG_17744 [Allomyces macrogynus ATCC 38327]
MMSSAFLWPAAAATTVPAQSHVHSILITTVVFLAFAAVLLPHALAAVPESCTPLLIDDFSHGTVATGWGTPNSVDGNAMVDYKAAPVANNQAELPAGTFFLREDLPCVDVSAYSGISFTFKYTAATGASLSLPRLVHWGYTALDKCQANSKQSGIWLNSNLGNLTEYRRPDGSFFVPKTAWFRGANVQFISVVALTTINGQSVSNVGPIWFECPVPQAVNATTTTLDTTTSSDSVSTPTSSLTTSGSSTVTADLSTTSGATSATDSSTASTDTSTTDLPTATAAASTTNSSMATLSEAASSALSTSFSPLASIDTSSLTTESLPTSAMLSTSFATQSSTDTLISTTESPLTSTTLSTSFSVSSTTESFSISTESSVTNATLTTADSSTVALTESRTSSADLTAISTTTTDLTSAPNLSSDSSVTISKTAIPALLDLTTTDSTFSTAPSMTTTTTTTETAQASSAAAPATASTPAMLSLMTTIRASANTSTPTAQISTTSTRAAAKASPSLNATTVKTSTTPCPSKPTLIVPMPAHPAHPNISTRPAHPAHPHAPAHLFTLPPMHPIWPTPARPNTPHSGKPTISVPRPLVPPLPMTVTLSAPPANPGFTLSMSTKTVTAFQTPVVVIVPVVVPRTTVQPGHPRAARALVQFDVDAVPAAASGATASETAMQEMRASIGPAVPATIAVVVVGAAVAAAVVVQRRRRSGLAMRRGAGYDTVARSGTRIGADTSVASG